jgi:hypothetical protein
MFLLANKKDSFNDFRIKGRTKNDDICRANINLTSLNTSKESHSAPKYNQKENTNQDNEINNRLVLYTPCSVQLSS